MKEWLYIEVRYKLKHSDDYANEWFLSIQMFGAMYINYSVSLNIQLFILLEFFG